MDFRFISWLALTVLTLSRRTPTILVTTPLVDSLVITWGNGRDLIGEIEISG